MKHQLSLKLIQHSVNDSTIEQRSSDGYINATDLCLAANKKWYNFLREENTGHFLRALSAKTEKPVSELIQEVNVKGEVSAWIHPKVATQLGQWLSAEFAVQVSEWVFDWMSGQGAPFKNSGSLPYHLERHMLNISNVPNGHFSVLQEMTLVLIAPLEKNGYTIPERMLPDISMGKFLCKHLREKIGVNTDNLPTYSHEFPDGRVVKAKAYPDDYLAIFRKIIREEWMTGYASEYFLGRAPEALPFLDKVITALPSKGRMVAANDESI